MAVVSAAVPVAVGARKWPCARVARKWGSRDKEEGQERGRSLFTSRGRILVGSCEGGREQEKEKEEEICVFEPEEMLLLSLLEKERRMWVEEERERTMKTEQERKRTGPLYIWTCVYIDGGSLQCDWMKGKEINRAGQQGEKTKGEESLRGGRGRQRGGKREISA